MAYPIDESFATGIPSGFAANSGLAVASIDVPNGEYVIWRILEAGYSTGFDFEADLELVSDYFGGNKHFGLWLLSGEDGPNFHRGWRFVSFVPYNLDVRDWGNQSSNAEKPSVLSPVVNTTGVVTWRVEARSYTISGGSYWSYRVTVGGVVFFEARGYFNTYGAMPALMPAIYVYGAKVHVHAIRANALAPEATGAANVDLQVGNRALLAANAQIGFTSLGLGTGKRNMLQGGSGRVAGTVTIENIPGARRVRLFNKRSGVMVGEVWSSHTGQYEFNGVDADQEYFVVAHDHLRVYNAVVQDMLAP